MNLNTTFGNPNMTAEYLAISAIFSLFFLFHLSTKVPSRLNQFLQISCALIIAAFIFSIYMLQARSVLLALFFILIYLYGCNFLKKRELLKIGLCLGAIWLTFIGQSSFQGHQTTSSINIISSKASSTAERYDLWRAALKLIKANPLGIGAGMTDFASIPHKQKLGISFNEQEIERTPHNEGLRYLSEDGFIVFILGLMFFYAFFRRRWPHLSTLGHERPLIIMSFIFFVIQSLFQFPFANPLPFFTFIVLFAYFLAKTSNHMSPATLNPRIARPLIFLLCIVYTVSWMPIAIAHHLLATHPEDEAKMKLACSIYPSDWRTCLYTIKTTVVAEKYNEAIAQADKELQKRPYNFPVIYLLGLSHYFSGHIEQGCQYLRYYDSLFDQKGSFHPIIEKLCNSSAEKSLPSR